MLAGRSDFTSIRQKEAQSVEEFAAALRAAAIHCKFGAELDIRLRDQFVIGLKTDAIRKRLMEKDDITFADALKQASDLERIAHDSKLVGRNETSVSQVQKKPDHRGSDNRSSQPRQFTPSNGPGYRQGNQFHNQHAPQRQGTGSSNSGIGPCRGCGKNHRRSNCKYTVNKMKCNACGIVGHKASVCQRKQSTTFRSRQLELARRRKQQQFIK